MAQWTYFHSMDPFIFALTETIGLRWYSMAYIVSFFLAWFILQGLIRKKESPLQKEDLIDLIFYVAIGVIVGGRTGYTLFYAPYLFTQWDPSFPYWEWLKIHKGGLASHGGIIGLIVAIILFGRRKGISAFHSLDLTVLGGSLGLFFGRITNFINGELFGRVIENQALWAVQFPQEMFNWVSEKKISALQDLTQAISHLKKPVSEGTWREWLYQLEATGQYQSAIYSVIRSLIKAVENGQQEIISALTLVISYRHPSQIYQAFLEGLLPSLIIWLVWIKRAFFIRLFPSWRLFKEGKGQNKPALRPGLVAGLWGICYGVARLVGEQFRMPDVHIGFQALGLTRGQWLTLFMLAGMGIYFVLLFRQKNPFLKR